MNGYGSHRSVMHEDVEGDPDHDDHGLEHEEPGGAEEAGDRLGEAAERIGVVAEPELPRRTRALARSSRRFTTSPSPSPSAWRSHRVGVAVALAPRRAELTVEHVVDGDGAEQVALRVAHRDGEHVVARQQLGDGPVGGVGPTVGSLLTRLRQLEAAGPRAAGAARGPSPAGGRSGP